MNNSFSRLIDGMCATLRSEVLARLDDEFARGQVFGVINLLNTFKVRADWSTTFLVEQIAVQQAAIAEALAGCRAAGAAPGIEAPAALPTTTPIADLMASRDANNRVIGELLTWLDQHREAQPGAVSAAEPVLRRAMRAETELELKYSPRPLFAEMSSGRED